MGQHRRAPGIRVNSTHIQEKRSETSVDHLGRGTEEQPVEENGAEDLQLLVHYNWKTTISKQMVLKTVHQSANVDAGMITAGVWRT